MLPIKFERKVRTPRRTKTISEIPAISYLEFPAKTFINEKGEIHLGRNVLNHCQIVGHIAKKLLEILPLEIRNKLFPEGSELIAASHDIGKVSPTFWLKLLIAAQIIWNKNHQFLERFQFIDEKQWGGHAGVSALTLQKENHSKAIQTIVGQHHGFTPATGMRDANAESFGGVTWQAERQKLILHLEQEFGDKWPENLSDAQIRVISGLTSVADWIGSGSLFDDPQTPWQPNIDKALEQAGYLPFQLCFNLTFSDIFGFSPREAQTTLINACDKPGVYVLEAPMGLGKTEAALYCAYKMIASKNATGIYFAMPTQLTSNKIYDRFNHFLTTVLAKDCEHRNALLLHGNAWLEETDMGKEGSPGSSWFNSNKRGLLAPFAVGTLDQALMAAMNVRHGFVRSFGLAGKVVILDEVHSYDAYTSVILEQLIALLKSLQCTVIILSATLSMQKRKELLAANVSNTAYPLVTAVQKDVKEFPVTPPAELTVNVQLKDDDLEALEEVLRRAELGQQVLWIENTVNDAQERYFDLAARCSELNLECGLLHSRFTPADRANNEAKWVNSLGKSGWSFRPLTGRIIIGTQVLEQSLDIDADFLISRFAPTDMLLQRLGRLWRHADTPRNETANCEAWFLSPSLDEAIKSPNSAFGASAAVYSEYILCRSLEAWGHKLNEQTNISLPNDIRPLIDATYFERPETGMMATHHYHLLEGTTRKKGLNALRQLARGTLSIAGKTLPDNDAPTRYSEEDSAEILLLQAMEIDSCSNATHLTLLDGNKLVLPWQKHQLPNQQWRKLSRQLMGQIVPCRRSQLPMTLQRNRCKNIGLGNVFYLGHADISDNVPFAIAIKTPEGQLKGVEQNLSDKYIYYYRQDIGLQISKIKE